MKDSALWAAGYAVGIIIMDRDYVALELLRLEYKQVKLEQGQRIGFRDNMVFVQLAAMGSVGSWVLSNLGRPDSVDVLLVMPWACLVLGWTYTINDYAISLIGKYIREVLRPRAKEMGDFVPPDAKSTGGESSITFGVFGWEQYHRVDDHRRFRKRIQWLIDEVTFVAPGLLSILAFSFLKEWKIMYFPYLVLLGSELVALALLAFIITQYSDTEKA